MRCSNFNAYNMRRILCYIAARSSGERSLRNCAVTYWRVLFLTAWPLGRSLGSSNMPSFHKETSASTGAASQVLSTELKPANKLAKESGEGDEGGAPPCSAFTITILDCGVPAPSKRKQRCSHANANIERCEKQVPRHAAQTTKRANKA